MRTEKPIIFSGPMVRAILDGRKTQTRRVVKYEVDFLGGSGDSPDDPRNWGFEDCENGGWWTLRCDNQDGYTNELPSPFQIGDVLWIKETTYAPPKPLKNCLGYVADGDHPHDRPYRKVPSIFMRRVAARIFLRVTGVRAERLQEISDDDCKAEGIGSAPMLYRRREMFRGLWDSLNAKRGYPWSSNPWVWAYTFKIERPDDEAGP